MRTIKKAIKKRVGIWIRVSTEDQARGESPEHHEKRAQYYADAKDWKVVEIYNLSGVSGKTVLEHPEAKRMLEHVKSGHISALIFSKLARLARNTRELLDIADIFREFDAGLISLQESIDTTSPAGRLFYTMIAAMAQWEREEISERVSASVPIRAKLGKPLGGAAPFGYKWEKQALVIDPNEAPIRKLMFELFAQHKRKRTVARLINEIGHRSRKGKKFTDTTIDRLLTDPIAKGLRRANYTKSTGEKKKWKLKPEDEWVYTKVEPIVSEELWNECNDFLEKQRKSNKKIARKPAVHLFSGLTFCHCEHKMYVPSNNPKYTCQKCRHKIPVDDLEAIYLEQLKDFLLSEKDMNAYLQQADDVIVDKTELLSLHEKERKKIQHEMDKIYTLYIEDKISSDGFGKTYKPLEERAVQLDTEILELQAEIDYLKINNLSSAQILTEARSLHGRWPTLSREEQQRIVETITEKIIIGQDEVTIHFHYLPFFSPTPPSTPPSSNTNNSSSTNGGNNATNHHGLYAAIKRKSAGNESDMFALAIVTFRSSNGCLSISSTRFLNSVSSSRKRTPCVAKETSPGLGKLPPPMSPASEIVWCGERNGRLVTMALSSVSVPAMLCTLVVSTASSKLNSGRIVVSLRASMVFPAPGGPFNKTLWLPLAAISSARLACSCPLTSEKSSPELSTVAKYV